MFVPVVTKDMQLFQNARQPPRIKNVRSRAQSLETNLNANGAPAGTSKSRVAPATNAASRGVSSSSRNCQSFGALPTSASSCAPSRSPPKTNSFRKPLDPIVEGVALRCGEKTSRCKTEKASSSTGASVGARRKSGNSIENQENDSVSSAKRSGSASTNNKSTPDLNALKITERQMQMNAAGLSLATTSSSPGLWKASCASTKSTKNISATTPTNLVASLPSASVADSSGHSSSGGRSLVKWLTNTLKGKNNSKDHGATACAKCARLDPDQMAVNTTGEAATSSCSCSGNVEKNAEEEKTWRSIVPCRQLSVEEQGTPSRDVPISKEEIEAKDKCADASETVSVCGS